LRHVKDP